MNPLDSYCSGSSDFFFRGGPAGRGLTSEGEAGSDAVATGVSWLIIS
jgi:hypothetical protein